MKTALFFVTIALVVIGAFVYLNRTPCEVNCVSSRALRCEELRATYTKSDYSLSYGDRVGLLFQGCF